jgi:hypothetical protein
MLTSNKGHKAVLELERAREGSVWGSSPFHRQQSDGGCCKSHTQDTIISSVRRHPPPPLTTPPFTPHSVPS